jgi:hypothetical protein
LERSVSPISHCFGKSSDCRRPLDQEHEISDLVSEREHQLMSARMERQRALHPPARAPTKQSIASVTPVDDEERQAQIQEDKLRWIKDLVRPGPVQFLASESLVSDYDDYTGEMSRDRKYGRLDFPRRLLGAIVAGGSLIVLMLIMSIHSSLKNSLIVSSCFVLAFELGAAWKSAMKPEDVLAANAAYTAVLIVFVGVKTSGTTFGCANLCYGLCVKSYRLTQSECYVFNLQHLHFPIPAPPAVFYCQIPAHNTWLVITTSQILRGIVVGYGYISRESCSTSCASALAGATPSEHCVSNLDLLFCGAVYTNQ